MMRPKQASREIGSLSRTPRLLRSLLARTTTRELTWKPARDRWSVAEILAHLSDVESAFRGRSRQIIEETHPLLDPYDALEAFGRGSYSGGQGREELRRFSDLRRQSLAWLRSLSGDAWRRTGEHPRLGAVRLEHLVHLWAFHDLGHLRQVTEVVRAVCHWEGIGPLQRFYSVHP